MSVDTVTRSFVDLRIFAADPPAGGLLDAGDILPASAGPVSISAIRLAGGGHVATIAVDMFVFVLSGSLTIGGQTYGANQSVVLPRSIAFDWQAGDGTCVIRIACEGDGSDATTAPVPIDEDAALMPSGAPLAELLVGPTPSCRNHTDFVTPSGEFICGTWDSTPYHRLPMRYLTGETTRAMFDFPPDMPRRQMVPNRLDTQSLVREFEQDWGQVVR